MFNNKRLRFEEKKVMNNESNRKKFIWIHGGFAALFKPSTREEKENH